MGHSNSSWIMVNGVLICTECKRSVATIELDGKFYQDCLCPDKMLVNGKRLDDSPEVVDLKQQLGAL